MSCSGVGSWMPRENACSALLPSRGSRAAAPAAADSESWQNFRRRGARSNRGVKNTTILPESKIRKPVTPDQSPASIDCLLGYLRWFDATSRVQVVALPGCLVTCPALSTVLCKVGKVGEYWNLLGPRQIVSTTSSSMEVSTKHCFTCAARPQKAEGSQSTALWGCL